MRIWSRAVLASLGVRVRITGERLHGPVLVVANHVSWLDILAIAAAQPAIFVCKSEVAAWPLVGWLVARARTIFIRRRSFRDIWRVNNALRERFAAGEAVAVFTEGTTTEGDRVLPFRTGIFQPAVDRAVPVLPVALVYSDRAAAFVGDTTFVTSLLAVMRARQLEVEVQFLSAVASSVDRRAAVMVARQRIVAAVGAPRGTAVAPTGVLTTWIERQAAPTKLSSSLRRLVQVPLGLISSIRARPTRPDTPGDRKFSLHRR